MILTYNLKKLDHSMGRLKVKSENIANKLYEF